MLRSGKRAGVKHKNGSIAAPVQKYLSMVVSRIYWRIQFSPLQISPPATQPDSFIVLPLIRAFPV